MSSRPNTRYRSEFTPTCEALGSDSSLTPPAIFSSGVGPLNASARQLGFFAILALVALRVGLGLHFFSEGAKKFVDPKPYSAGFLSSAKGPFAPLFHSMVWDANGLERLDAAQTEKMWDEYRERIGRHYGFDDAQRDEAKRVYDKRRGQLRWVLEDNAADLNEYVEGLERVSRYQNDAARTDVASLQGQLATIESDLWKTRNKVLPTIDKLWADYALELNSLATEEQKKSRELGVGKARAATARFGVD